MENQVTKKSTIFSTKDNWFKRFYSILYMVFLKFFFRFYDIDNEKLRHDNGQTVIKSTADMANIKYNKELGDPELDSNIYIDTDSVFFSIHHYLINEIPSWSDNNQDTILQYVNDIAEEMQDYLNDFYDILSEKIFNVDKDKHRLEIKKEYVQ